MNKIRLQDLTPDIYYSHSRDFQFIGRLFDVVLNSTKVNADSLYNLPLNENTDERLIDLMTMTLGFKSRHNYNVKQLTSLCSAFTTIIKNKGNIQSIIDAVNALLNAEGITDELDYDFEENNTVLNLFIPQTLTDINLLKDLLIYILPAGMSCNIIREFRETKKATSETQTVDELTIYEGTYDSGTTGSFKQKLIGTQSEAKSVVSTAEEYGITDALAKSYPGLLANTDVYRPAMEGSASVASLFYNITYVTNGGKITNEYTIDGKPYHTPYSYKVGTNTKLPTMVVKANTVEGEGSEKKTYKFTFNYWCTDLKNPESTKVTEITATDCNNKIFYAYYTKQEIN